MKLMVVGATGRTGRLLVPAALAAGHTVYAFGRALGRVGPPHPELKHQEGDLRNPADVDNAVRWRPDAVVWLARARPRESTPVDHRVLGSLLRRMEIHGVPWLLIPLSLGTNPDERGRLPWTTRWPWTTPARRHLLAAHRELARTLDASAGFNKVRQSLLFTWELGDGAPTGAWTATELENYEWRVRGLNLTLPRADLAAVLLRELDCFPVLPTCRLVVLPPGAAVVPLP